MNWCSMVTSSGDSEFRRNGPAKLGDCEIRASKTGTAGHLCLVPFNLDDLIPGIIEDN